MRLDKHPLQSYRQSVNTFSRIELQAGDSDLVMINFIPNNMATDAIFQIEFTITFVAWSHIANSVLKATEENTSDIMRFLHVQEDAFYSNQLTRNSYS